VKEGRRPIELGSFSLRSQQEGKGRERAKEAIKAKKSILRIFLSSPWVINDMKSFPFISIRTCVFDPAPSIPLPPTNKRKSHGKLKRTSESRRACMPFCSLSSVYCKSDFSLSNTVTILLYFLADFFFCSIKFNRSASIVRY
jgi:hypothetical protein